MTVAKDRLDEVAAKKASTTRKTSLYRLRSSAPAAEEDLISFVIARYLERDGFTSRPVDQDGIRGLLVTGTVAPGTADWCDPVSALTGQDVTEENRTAFGLLLIRTESAVYGLAYGLGYLMIDPARIEPRLRHRVRGSLPGRGPYHQGPSPADGRTRPHGRELGDER